MCILICKVTRTSTIINIDFMIDIVFFNNPLINSTYLYLNDYIKYIFLFTLVIVPVISYGYSWFDSGRCRKKSTKLAVCYVYFSAIIANEANKNQTHFSLRFQMKICMIKVRSIRPIL